MEYKVIKRLRMSGFTGYNINVIEFHDEYSQNKLIQISDIHGRNPAIYLGEYDLKEMLSELMESDKGEQH